MRCWLRGERPHCEHYNGGYKESACDSDLGVRHDIPSLVISALFFSVRRPCAARSFRHSIRQSPWRMISSLLPARRSFLRFIQASCACGFVTFFVRFPGILPVYSLLLFAELLWAAHVALVPVHCIHPEQLDPHAHPRMPVQHFCGLSRPRVLTQQTDAATDDLIEGCRATVFVVGHVPDPSSEPSERWVHRSRQTECK